jgi:hypothetical protein
MYQSGVMLTNQLKTNVKIPFYYNMLASVVLS